MKVPLDFGDLNDDERDAFVKAMFAAVDLSDPAAVERFLAKLEELKADDHSGAQSLAKKIAEGEVELDEV